MSDKDQEPGAIGPQQPPTDGVEPEALGADPVVDPAPQPEALVEKPRRGGGLAILAVLLLGGAATAVAWYDPLQWRGAGGVPPEVSAEITALTGRLQAAEAANAALEQRLVLLEAQPAPVSADALAALEAQAQENQAALAALQSAPAGEDVSAGQVAALVQSVAQLKDELAKLKQDPPEAGVTPEALKAAVDAAMAARDEAVASEAAATAEATRQLTARNDAVTALRAAADSGAPFAELLPTLQGLSLDPVLQDAASTGLATRQSLIDSFPAAARAALNASLRATSGTGIGDRLSTFLRIQTGARSVVPQDGTDPDAVLSRAEAATAAGDFAMALQELNALPAEGQAEMAEWSGQAKTWLSAQDALNKLAAAAAVQGG
ncbi:hypothetical protein Q9295_02430 [Xinfangfangia sp. CPCC 101601]|uniref:Mitochondrial inner membrane protein n=1 Tax=Pseudogemmobacter lacusdianii TaxID=3069608 RepID=A0ABU0VUJ0_9RHOB|nr:hypothetical protein [Xinfangfangia sp. CPCC 101601]MDQ2065218.1 hypothetical protein [Xinfangfangia sp. CPCC 101601]